MPGTGKTILSQSVVNNLNLRLLKIKGNFEITEIINLIKLFKIEAVILDDFEYNDKTDTFLELLEVLNKNIKLTIAILNNDESLSPALLRPGRFDRQIEVNLPDVNGRYKILKLHSKNKPISKNVDLKDLH